MSEHAAPSGEPTVTTTLVDTPAGAVRVAVVGAGAGAGAGERVVVAAFDDHFERLATRVRARIGGTWVEGESRSAECVRRYVAGDLDALRDVSVDATGTPFQRRVWDALRAVPAGSTASYADIAAAVGAPGAVRAVGSANGANPVWLIVPCHRVVRSDGALGGYGGGVERKAWLLAHEGARAG